MAQKERARSGIKKGVKKPEPEDEAPESADAAPKLKSKAALTALEKFGPAVGGVIAGAFCYHFLTPIPTAILVLVLFVLAVTFKHKLQVMLMATAGGALIGAAIVQAIKSAMGH